MDDNTMKLSEIPEIKELMQVLSDNGLFKEKNNVKHLVSYIEDMENKIIDMTVELREMHNEVGKIRDSTLRARCTQLVTAASEKIQQTKQMVVSCKDNLVRSAANALKAFKEKGKDALVSAVNAMKIPSALEMLKNGFHKAADSIGKSAANLVTVREELHDVGTHLKNAGRALIGKPIKENEELKADKGILGKLQIFLQKTAAKFTDMEHSAEEKAKNLRETYEERKSVKTDLKKLKAEQAKAKNAPAVAEPSR